MIFKAENVLTAEVVKEMYDLRTRVENIDVDGHKWRDVCLKIPVIRQPKCFDPSKLSLYDYFFGKKRRRRWTDWEDEDEEDDFFVVQTNNETNVADDECKDVELPDISSIISSGVSLSDLTEFKTRMETEGFSLSLAEDVSYLIDTIQHYFLIG